MLAFFHRENIGWKKVRKCRLFQLTIVFLVLAFSSWTACVPIVNHQPNRTESHSVAQTQIDLSGIRVGIYEGYLNVNEPRVVESRTALINMFEWMNASVQVFNTTDIINGSLWSCEVLAIPEGLGPIVEAYLTEPGLQKIREWVSAGGSYIGVRGSAAIAVQYSYFEQSYSEFGLALINGTSYEVTEYDPQEIINVTVNTECTGPDLSDMPETMSVLFETGRYILPNEGQELLYIANYTYNSTHPAMVASYYGEGNVFISSPHFEYEENGDRDGTTYKDTYDDPDTEWPFMLRITRWLIDSSPTVCNLTTWPTATPSGGTREFPIEMLLVGGGVGIVVIAVIAIYAKRR